MEVRRTAHWLGSSVRLLEKTEKDLILNTFTLIEHDTDVSILSEPSTQFAFFFIHSEEQYPLLLTALKLSINLNKKLILIHSRPIELGSYYHSAVFDHLNLSLQNTQEWLKQLISRMNLRWYVELGGNASAQAADPMISQALQSLLNHIDNNISNVIREEDAASFCHYSITYFSKVFHKEIGLSFRDYLSNKRINLAKQLLLEDRHAKIAFIAYQCGYRDVSYFSRIFKKKTGVSPGKYRLSN
ncbi:helix-turn-helix transcriptional regulator [Vibrio vulnificus]|uniref:HTH araC/xylS-type domain-containing protein n=3 Tax=Vibrio vulnificus TaxID=672 RepID=Q7MI51_VIBVY|nr:helix-turn-helix transcriptional regulator [Vibrio vulnificus]OJI59738.1 HTH-type transcriptional activator Btr [Vibrio fluvialis]AAO10156.1 Transcriptional regulator, AraC family [Vibrio vulnificus CMCP6]ADV85659.1 transcriptional regulator AraC family [Vibrio vulnificus MO6-24/O]AIL71461.1 AraC family transcriptional regulator [Vibrio vulnificus]ANN25659.1 Transcriptional regulator, AraC family [Vibrio vulnificus]